MNVDCLKFFPEGSPYLGHAWAAQGLAARKLLYLPSPASIQWSQVQPPSR